jgi:hypothetical protein
MIIKVIVLEDEKQAVGLKKAELLRTVKQSQRNFGLEQ